MAREFQGELITKSNYRDILIKEGRAGINYHNAHLRAYKEGLKFFRFGKDHEGKPKWHPVMEKINED